MKAIGIVARKELRTYFDSPVALIFLAVFLLASLFAVFGYSGFFARNIADVRPLFAWLPLLLIFLVAAITMRQWAEERKMGTLEVLLTLPVRTSDLILGKFIAGVLLVGVALALTLPLPLMVARLGDLDLGPVVGGYLGAMLVGATYLAIGLCVSARTDNQVVSLMITLLIGGGLYLLGSDPVTQLFGNTGSELLRDLGSGSRFQSIERGVIDVRDLAYYGSVAAFFLLLNAYFLESERVDAAAREGGRQLARRRLVLGLAGANLLVLNLWLAPINTIRVDLTEGGEYSISGVTRQTLRELGDPLRIRGYFSQRNHPLLAPLVPQIEDLLDEYEIAGDGRVSVEIIDPNRDEAIEEEIGERYGIRSVPFRVSDRHQQAVVNAFFHLVVEYGDQFEVLSFAELIDVHYDESEIDVRLKNLEYDLTRTIKRVSQNFQNIESLFALLPESATLTAYVTPETMPSDFADKPEQVRSLAADLVESSGGKLRFEEVDPSGDPQLAQRLADELDVRPLAVDLFGRQTFYLDLVLQAGPKTEHISVLSAADEGELRRAMEAAVRRVTPGQLKVVGLYTDIPDAPPPNPQLPPQLQPPPPQPDYRGLSELLGEDYDVQPVDPSDGVIRDDIDVLIVGKPGALDETSKFAFDQFLMRGGKLIALAGRYTIDPHRGGLQVQPHPTAFYELLESWGVSAPMALVMDEQNAAFPIPVSETRGGFRLQRIRLLPYPFFPDIRRDGFAEDAAALVGLQGVTMPWASPLEVTPNEAVEAQVLLQTSPGSWQDTSGSIEPDFTRHPESGFAVGAPQERQTVAVALSGRIPSHYAERPSPLFTAKDDEEPVPDAEPDATGRTLKQSLPDARLVVLGSAEMTSDLMLQLAAQPGGEMHRGNLQLIQNLVDWSTEDTALLQIRSSGAFARTLRPLADGEAPRWEWGTYTACLLLLGIVVWTPRARSRSRTPIAIPPELIAVRDADARGEEAQ